MLAKYGIFALLAVVALGQDAAPAESPASTSVEVLAKSPAFSSSAVAVETTVADAKEPESSSEFAAPASEAESEAEFDANAADANAADANAADAADAADASGEALYAEESSEPAELAESDIEKIQLAPATNRDDTGVTANAGVTVIVTADPAAATPTAAFRMGAFIKPHFS
ncbi:hypothetical protein EV175_005629 [Coemansia sp. RSA 1933]|nr:hypothetical protein EV175_005629 [Coemansia sp. RSA 1933]